MINLAPISFNYGNIINSSSSLNDYKIGWWLGLPNTSGGKYFYDLFQLNNGTLNGFTDSSYGWKSSTKPSGYTSLRFNGNGDYISIEDNNIFKFANNNFSVSCWFMLETLNNPNSNGLQTIISRYESAISRGFSVDIDTIGRVIFRISQSSILFGEFTSSAIIQANTWHHCLIYRNGFQSFLYIDGRLRIIGASASILNISSGTQNLLFGDMVTNSGQHQYFQGYIDDISIYNNNLSTSSARKIYIDSIENYSSTLNFINSNDTNSWFSTNKDIKSRMLGSFSFNGDIESFIGIEFLKSADTYGLVLKAPGQERVYFEFDVQTLIS